MIPLEPILDKYEIRYRGTSGNQNIRCPHPDHDDRHQSASAALDKGLWNCHACGKSGSAVDLVMAHEGLNFREAFAFAQDLAGTSNGQVSPVQTGMADYLPGRQGNKRDVRRYVPPWLRQ